MNLSAAPIRHRARQVRMEFLIALAGAVACALMIYSLTAVSGLADRHQQLQLDSWEIELRLTTAYLSMDRALTQKATVRPEREVFGNFDIALRIAHRLAADPALTSALAARTPPAPDARDAAIAALPEGVAELRRLAEARFLSDASAAAGSPADVAFDQRFLAVLKLAEEINWVAQSLVDDSRIQSARLQLLVLLALLFLFAGIIALVFQNRRADRQRQAELERRVEERTVQLREANGNLARAAQLKDEFLAAMSHELRTPLNAVLGFTELLLEGIHGDVNEKQAKSLRAVDESARHLLSLINDILDLSKIEAGQETLHLESTAIEPLCQASIRFVRQLAAKKKLTLVTDIDLRLESLPADERRLRQILINLLTNAVKFTPDGGKVGLEVAPITGEPLVCFTVWDTGIGISAEDQAKLFRPFVQLDSRLSRQYTGTGLGLSLVLRLTELHGGRVTLDSSPGKGSRFSVFLPTTAVAGAATAATAATAAPTVAPAEVSFPLLRARRPTVLLIEANVLNQETLLTYLSAQGCQVTVAKDGCTGLALAARLRPAVVLTGIHMPGMDGLETTRWLKRAPETASVPVISLTALAMSGDREACLPAGANEYLTKPVNLKQLAALIEQLVAAHP